MTKVYIFDLNGTLIDDMDYHLLAWSKVLNDELQSDYPKDNLKLELYGTNKEILYRIFNDRTISDEEIQAISLRKERLYRKIYRPHLRFLQGLEHVFNYAEQNDIKLAIGTATVPENIDFVLENSVLKDKFDIVLSANDVQKNKPNPELFLEIAERLKVHPEQCIVFEDSPKGVEAAMNARMRAIVLLTTYKIEDFITYNNVILAINDFDDNRLLPMLGSSSLM